MERKRHSPIQIEEATPADLERWNRIFDKPEPKHTLATTFRDLRRPENLVRIIPLTAATLLVFAVMYPNSQRVPTTPNVQPTAFVRTFYPVGSAEATSSHNPAAKPALPPVQPTTIPSPSVERGMDINSQLRAGSDPWKFSRDTLRSFLGHEPTDTQIMELDIILSQQSDINVHEWEINESSRSSASDLPVGFRMNISNRAKDYLLKQQSAH